ncbi:MAG: GAF domain-containing protein [Bacteroidetes bacterium]|nr:GAF domain-containing protein [Bacteroidota bacterium]
MLDQSINLLDELDNLSKVHWLEREEIDSMFEDFAKRIIVSLKIERINAWIYSQDKTSIVSMGEYDIRTREFKKESVIEKVQYPVYFKALEENKIIVAENIHTHKATKELSKDYAKPLGVESLMDIPLRIAGELVGVICFEKAGSKKKFTLKEQRFAISVSFILTSNLEARHRRAAQAKLDKALHEKDLLIKEINHRVRNNFAILISLLRISKDKGKTTDPKIIFEEYEQRIISMIKIHDLLCQSKNYTSINLSDYLKELVSEFKKTHADISHEIIEHIDIVNCYLPTKEAIHMGLIVTEVFLNSFKHSFLKNNDYKLYIGIKKDSQEQIHIKIGDNGKGFDFTQKVKQNTLGLNIIKDLAEGMDLVTKFPSLKDNMYEFMLDSNTKQKFHKGFIASN